MVFTDNRMSLTTRSAPKGQAGCTNGSCNGVRYQCKAVRQGQSARWRALCRSQPPDSGGRRGSVQPVSECGSLEPQSPRDLKHHHLVRRDGPLACQIQIARLHIFHKSLRLEPAGLYARPSGRHLAAFRQRLQHAFDVIVPFGRFLPCDGAIDAVAHQEQAHTGIGSLDQVQRQAQCVEGALISIGRIVDDEQVICLFRLSHEMGSFSVTFLGPVQRQSLNVPTVLAALSRKPG